MEFRGHFQSCSAHSVPRGRMQGKGSLTHDEVCPYTFPLTKTA